MIRKDSSHLFPYEWELSNHFPSYGIDYHGSKVFSCFAGGGGSSMGYKLAGYDVLGCCEIDPRMSDCYEKNLNPKIVLRHDIRKLVTSRDLPNELYELDILDGSPPCSTFSMVGLREKSWGVNKKFREGQSEQILDTLFFDFIALAKKLKPKIVIAENVSGIRKGTSEQIYIPKIMKAFESAGYVIMCMAVNSAKLGVPQNRDRVFFFAVRSDLIQFINTVGFIKIPKPLSLPAFKNIPYNSIEEDKNGMFSYINKDSEFYKLWENTKCGNLFVDAYQRLNQTNKRVWFSQIKLHPDLICPTITSQLNYMTHYEVPRYISDLEIKRASSWPLDYDFLKQKVGYVCGMSVPPVMMAHVAHAVYNQWLIKIKENT